ncbi:MAG: glycosyltransferase family 39 protein [Chloroflexi bacterium]|nr:glycosyltransferase family 39 protein [Chloroflexota bacterium]
MYHRAVFKKTLPFLILLFAFSLRAYGLLSIPPGLTHDEAGHGHDAANILKGVAPIYFTVGYGREPLFDYVNSILIFFMGANILTLRFAAVAWGTITLALTYRLARTAFNRNTAIIALALMSVSFWQLETSRQILRSGTLPVEITVAVILFLKLDTKAQRHEGAKKNFLLIAGLGIAIAASFYTYIPSRILWLLFPLTLITNYLLPITYRTHHASRNTLYAIILAFLLASPLFIYLSQHPEAEQRIGMLNEPLTQLQNGDPSQLINNAREFFFALFLNGHGDHFLAYTIPGRALFDPIMAVLFIIGMVLILKWSVISDQSSVIAPLFTVHCSLFTVWLLLGLAPSLIIGPEAMTTRIIGAQPILYIIPAIALNRLLVISNWRYAIRNTLYALCSLFIVSLFITTTRDYFFTWGNSPDVRAAYQSTTIAMVKSLDSPAVISTIYPSAAHDPYIAELITAQETRWVDGRTAILIPNRSTFKLLVPSSTPLHPSFAKYVQPIRTLNLRPTDLDPSFTIYSISNLQSLISNPPFPISNFNNAIELIDARWSAPSYKLNDVAELITVWRVTNSKNLGAIHPPAYKTDLNLFTHVLKEGEVYLQRDALDAPSWDWQTGDVILQIHQIAIPSNAAKGEYKVKVGIYDRVTNQRLEIRDSGENAAMAPPLVIQ